MTVATLKRTEKKNALDQIKPVNELDDIKDLDVNPSTFKQAIEEYKNFLNLPNSIFCEDDVIHAVLRIYHKAIILPKEIEIFKDRIVPFYENWSFSDIEEDFWSFSDTGYFLTNLIQNSYNAGHNNFNIGNNGFSYLGMSLEGKKENPLIMNIEENYGDLIGNKAKNIIFNVKKEKNFDRIEKGGFTIGCESKNCILKSPDKKTLTLTADSGLGSSIKEFYLIQPNGDEIPYIPKKK